MNNRQQLLDALRPRTVRRLVTASSEDADYPRQLRASLEAMAEVDALVEKHGVGEVLVLLRVAARNRGVRL